jgi:MFS family permease
LYIAEVVPTQHRGKLVTYSEIALNIGIVLGFSTGLIFAPLRDGMEWRCMLAFGTIQPLLMISLLWMGIMPESPRWLISTDRFNDARKILQNIYPAGHDVDQIIHEIRESITRETIAERQAVGWKTIFCPTPAIRRMMLVGVGTAVAQQAVGIDAIQYYLIDVIERLGIPSDTTKSSIILILLGSLKLTMIVVGGQLFDKHGRRPLIFLSLIGMATALLAISAIFLVETPSLASVTNITVLIALALYLSFFSIGIGPSGWLIPSEVFSLSIRGRAMSVATLCNRVVATLMSSTFLSTVKLIGWSGFFFMLFLICIVIFAFLYYYLPETNGQSLESMALYFAEITDDTYILDAEARIIENASFAQSSLKQRIPVQSYRQVTIFTTDT